MVKSRIGNFIFLKYLIIHKKKKSISVFTVLIITLMPKQYRKTKFTLKVNKKASGSTEDWLIHKSQEPNR